MQKDKSHYGIEAATSDKWNSSRNELDSLYKSEKYFFKPLIKKSFSFL